MNKIFLKNILVGLLVLTIFLPAVLFAESPTPASPGSPTPTPTDPVKLSIKIKNPFSGGNDLYSFIKTIINEILIPIGGVVAVLMIMYAGFLYVTARGNPAQISKAHDALLYGAIGAAILLGAWVIAGAIEGTVNELKV